MLIRARRMVKMGTLVFGNQDVNHTSKGMRPITKELVWTGVLLGLLLIIALGFYHVIVTSVTEELTKNALVAKIGNMAISSEAVSPGGMLKMSFKFTCEPGIGKEDTYTFTGRLNLDDFGGSFNFPSKAPFRCIPDIGSKAGLERLKEAIFKVISHPEASQAEQFALRQYVDIVVGVIKSHLMFVGF